MTATPGEVLSGYKFVGASTDDVQVGTLQLTGNAATNHVLSGTTFYTNNPKNKLTGYMAINNIRGFSVSLISGRNVTVQWTNPVQTAGYPYSGVYVKYQTGSYPTPSTGTQAYKGVGSSGASGAVSQINLTMPSLGTTYYFICYSYCITSNGELIGLPWQTTVNTGSSQIITINATQNYTIPAGYNSVDLFCVGGGGSGSWMNSKYTYGGGGGGGAYGGGGWGSANTGGGGGGQYWPNGTNGGNGGSGVILIRIK